MDVLTGSACRFPCPPHDPNWRSVTEDAVLDSSRRRVVTTTADDEGAIICTTIEEWEGMKLRSRRVEHQLRISTEEIFEPDGSLISSNTTRYEPTGAKTLIRVCGQGKSATTRIQCGSTEIRANERIILIETPNVNYRYLPFEGTWQSYYKESRMTLNMESCLLKTPDGVIYGPDRFVLVFRNGRLVDYLPPRELPQVLNLQE